MNRNSFMKAAAALLSIPLFGNEIPGDNRKDKINSWYERTMASRNPNNGATIMLQSRVHDKDLNGFMVKGRSCELIHGKGTIDAYKDDFGELFDRHGKSINFDFNLCTYKANLKTGKVNYYLTDGKGGFIKDADGNVIEGIRYFDAPLLFVRDAKLTEEKMQQMRDLIND